MVKSFIIGIGFIVSIAVAWVLIQTLWKKVFREEYTHDDVLAGRRNCSNCGCTTVCKRKEGGKINPKMY